MSISSWNYWWRYIYVWPHLWYLTTYSNMGKSMRRNQLTLLDVSFFNNRSSILRYTWSQVKFHPVIYWSLKGEPIENKTDWISLKILRFHPSIHRNYIVWDIWVFPISKIENSSKLIRQQQILKWKKTLLKFELKSLLLLGDRKCFNTVKSCLTGSSLI